MDSGNALADEIESVQYIYPELDVRGGNECYISIPVQLNESLVIRLVSDNKSVLEETKIDNLPPITFEMSFPDGYPYEKPPCVKLVNVETWLGDYDKSRVYEELFRLWDDFKDVSIYNYIDYVKTNSEVAFGKDVLELNRDGYQNLINANVEAKQVIFDNLTFACDICQSEQKGVSCAQFACGHTFCNACLKDYFTHIIQRGEIESVHCPSFECTKLNNEEMERLNKEALNGEITDFKKFDHEFFKLPLETSVFHRFLNDSEECDSLVQRYLMLFKRKSMDRYRKYFPNRVTECPRSICSTTFIRDDIESRLVICPTCNFAYCCDCFHSWHGEINSCSMYMKKLPLEVIETWLEHNGNSPRDQNQDDIEVCSNITFKYGRKIVELAVNDHIAQVQFEELIKSGEAEIIKCPSCNTYIQRADGCNKMTCSKCLVFFCNLCGDRLNRSDPYEHYNNPMGKCFGKLFEGIVSEEARG